MTPPKRHRRTPAETMPERGHGGLQEHVIDVVASIPGTPVLCYHTWRSDHSPKGFPDCFMAGPGGVLAMELKRHGATPTKPQWDWLAMLSRNGIPGVVRYPEDLFSGRITAEITALAGLPLHTPDHLVRALARVLQAAAPDETPPALADCLARAVLRAGYKPPHSTET